MFWQERNMQIGERDVKATARKKGMECKSSQKITAGSYDKLTGSRCISLCFTKFSL